MNIMWLGRILWIRMMMMLMMMMMMMMMIRIT